jgi:integrase
LGDDELVFPIRRDSYTTAVARAVEKYNRTHPNKPIEVWSPHQLRHAKAHEIRERFGLEHVQATLGHAEFSMSERYAQATLGRAVEAAAVTG